MRKSIAAEYFSLCISLVTAACLVVAAALICFSVATFQRDRRRQLESEGTYARQMTLDNISSHKMDFNYLTELYRSEGLRCEADFLLFDAVGDCMITDNSHPFSESRISAEVRRMTGDNGLFDISTLGGLFPDRQICLLSRLSDDDGCTYYLLSYMSAEGMYDYLWRMVIVFVAVWVLILMIMFPVLKYAVDRIVKPVKEMTMAAKRFGEGDFSEKVTVADRSEMGFLANTLNEMAYALESIEENRKSFVSNVSHELRTPMTTIGGFVDGILDGTIPESRHREYLTIVSEEINRLARLVRSMLNISKYEAGELELQTEDFDLTALTVKTVLLFEKRIDDKGIDIRGLDADRFFVRADMDLTQQVIYNLTENAVKFVDKGGYISYEFGHNEEGLVTLSIRNSGEGLKKNEIHRVFDRFYKTDESRGKDKTGVGLGLSIVRSIIKLHGGSVLVRSKQGEYTEFEFTLPAGEMPVRRG